VHNKSWLWTISNQTRDEEIGTEREETRQNKQHTELTVKEYQVFLLTVLPSGF
jgi:hypothetical protein